MGGLNGRGASTAPYALAKKKERERERDRRGEGEGETETETERERERPVAIRDQTVPVCHDVRARCA